jgi:hypothetical protein
MVLSLSLPVAAPAVVDSLLVLCVVLGCIEFGCVVAIVVYNVAVIVAILSCHRCCCRSDDWHGGWFNWLRCLPMVLRLLLSLPPSSENGLISLAVKHL